MQLASVPRKHCGHHDKFVMAAQAGPLRGALALGVTVFAYPDNFVTKRIIQHAITMAKTRATAMLRQQHIPPNVMLKRSYSLTNSILLDYYLHLDRNRLNITQKGNRSLR